VVANNYNIQQTDTIGLPAKTYAAQRKKSSAVRERCMDTSGPKHFGHAEVSGHLSNTAEVSWKQLGITASLLLNLSISKAALNVSRVLYHV